MKKILIKVLTVLNVLLYFITLFLWVVVFDNLTLCFATTIFTLLLTVFIKISTHQKIIKSPRLLQSMTSIILAVLLFALIGYIGLQRDYWWDVTEDKINSLSQASVQVVKSIEDKITFLVFAKKTESAEMEGILSLYKLHNPAISIRVIDPEQFPQKVKEYGVLHYGTVVILKESLHKNKEIKKEMITEITELRITNGLIRLLREKKKRIFFCEGHGEINIQSTEPTGASFLSEFLTQNSYELTTGRLHEISQDLLNQFDLVVLWGPQKKLFTDDISKIKKYMQKAGHLLVAMGAPLTSQKQIELHQYLASLGLYYADDIVVTRSLSKDADPTITVSHQFDAKHLITAGLI
ncbi:MAG: Gldg family protein, partial [Bacteriovoracaceae bacterium]|nr:Gldg family protein [Bacteriovoracaceae bacterium]